SGLPEQAKTVFVLQRDPAELRPRDSLNPVMASQTIIEEGMIRRHQIDDAAILQEDTADEQLGFRREVFAQRLVESLEDRRIGLYEIETVQSQPLHRKAADKARRFRIRQHPLDLSIDRARLAQTFRNREVEQFFVGSCVPEKEGKTRRQFEISE